MSEHALCASRDHTGGTVVSQVPDSPTSSVADSMLEQSCTSIPAASSHAPSVVVGVTAGIAAYKIPTLVRGLRSAGCDVTVVPTPASLSMVGRTVWEALSGKPAYSNVTDAADNVTHVRIGSEADVLVIAPATANTIAKLSAGIADNLLTATALVATCPVLVAPAMHTQMWNHPSTQANIATLRERGVLFIGPASGRLTGSDSGVGRMSEPEDIVRATLALLARDTRDTCTAGASASSNLNTPTVSAASSTPSPVTAGVERSQENSLAGRHVVISAGGTREPIDPVRFIGNRSTGRMGVALANEAKARGAVVTLVGAHLEQDVLAALCPDIDIRSANTAADMHNAIIELAPHADVIIMAAAVADYRPARTVDTKVKKTSLSRVTLELEENPDILADIAHHRRNNYQIIVGFAAETGDSSHSVREYGIEKARRKGADLLVINEVGDATGFGSVPTCITVVTNRGEEVATACGSKHDVARVIMGVIDEAYTAKQTCAHTKS